MVDPFADGQITHLLSLLGSGRKRPFAVEMLAGIQSGHPQLMVKRHPHADRDEVHVGMLDHFVRVGKSVGNTEMLGRFVGGFRAARADRRDLELRKRAQGRNVGIAPPAVAQTCSNDADTDFACHHDVSSLSGLSTLRWTRSMRQRSGNLKVGNLPGFGFHCACSCVFKAERHALLTLPAPVSHIFCP
jgi:hypothetical protein